MLTPFSLKTLATSILPSQFLDYRRFFDGLYQAAKDENARYSYQSFADDLGFGPTTVMHQIIRGYRPLTAKTGLRISQVLALDGFEKDYLLCLVELTHAKSAGAKELALDRLLAMKSRMAASPLDADRLQYFSAWYHPIIREMVALPDYRHEAAWIVERLAVPLSEDEAKASLVLLQRLKYIAWNAQARKWEQTTVRVTTEESVRGLALTRFHQLMIDQGREALLTVAGKRRNVSALSFTCDGSAFETIDALLDAFKSQVLEVADRSVARADRLYQMNIQMFPFTKAEDEDD